MRTYGNTSIHERLQKNLNLISFQGRVAPALKADQFLGATFAAPDQLRSARITPFFPRILLFARCSRGGSISDGAVLTVSCFRLKRQTRQAPKCSRRDGESRAHRPPCGRWADRFSSDAAYRSARGARPAPCQTRA